MIKPGKAQEADGLNYKFQLYQEEEGRIEVLSHYLLLEQNLPYDFLTTAKVLTNIITGATPTGLSDPEDPDKLDFVEIEDQRWASVFSLSKRFERHSYTFEYAYSKESDYESRGYSLRSLTDFNQRNTTLELGIAYNDDLITAAPLLGNDRSKDTLDFNIGLSQLLGPKTIFQVNLGAGYSRGYLGDPYKSIGKEEVFEIPGFPTFTETIAYFENRPDERVRYVFRLGLLQYVESLGASVEGSYRLFQDDQGITAHTLAMAWNQKIGDHLILAPYYRYYHQSEADYYYPDLDGTDIIPNDDRNGRAPFYSADYRLSSLDAHTFGIRLEYSPNDWLRIDLSYERYAMFGNDKKTASAAYPKADIVNFGISARY